MATAKKLPSGQWRTLIYSHMENGKRKYESFTADTKKESEFLATQFKLLNKKNSDITIKNAIEKYIKIKNNVLSPKTIREYTIMLNNRFTLIGDLKLNKLNDKVTQNWINSISQNLAPKSVRNTYGLLTATLALENSSYVPDIKLPQPIKPKIHIPTDDELKKLFQINTDPVLKTAMLLSAFGSLRRSEICALTFEDIHSNYITINKALVLDDDSNYVVKQPKTLKSYRNIPLPDFIINEIGKGCGRIVNINPDALTSRFKRLVKKSGLPHIRFHDLRHYQASILHALGIPDQYIMERGGWSSKQTLANIYQHTMPDKETQFTNLINNYFSNMQHEIQHGKK